MMTCRSEYFPENVNRNNHAESVEVLAEPEGSTATGCAPAFIKEL